MRVGVNIIFLALCMLAPCPIFGVSDTTTYVPSIRFEADVGAATFGYHGVLQNQYGFPTGFTFGARLGQSWGKWTTGVRLSQVTLDELSFEGQHFFDGRLRPVRVEVAQRHTVLALDVRRDFGNHRVFYPFLEGGIAASRMAMRLHISDARIPEHDEDAHVDSRTLHVSSKSLLTLGVGARLNLSALHDRRPNRRSGSDDNIFLDLRLSYGFGGAQLFVNTAAETAGTPSTSHSLYRRPIETSDGKAFFIGFTLGVRINN